MELERIESALRRVVEGRKWVVPVDVAAAAVAEVEGMRRWGASDVLVVAASPGVGDQPDCEVISLDLPPSDSIMGGIRAFHHALSRPS